MNNPSEATYLHQPVSTMMKRRNKRIGILPQGMKPCLTRGEGFTLIEIIVVIAIIAMVAAILTPTIAKQLEDSKISRAMSDEKIIAAAMSDFYKDNNKWPMFINPSQPLSENNIVWLLIGTGRDAAVVSSDNSDTKFWNEVGGWPSYRIDRVEDHLICNEPPLSHYNPEKWRGPYLSKITSDPWGTHYAINTAYLTAFFPEGEVVWVISAGKNKTWETDISQVNSSSMTIGGDDIAFRLK